MANILAVDDEQDILVLIKNILERDHHTVSIMKHTKDKDLGCFQGYDLILLDVMMPDIDGFTLCEKIRSVVTCPILFLTAKVTEDAVVKGLMTGADDYILKPFGVQELSARVNAHLRREERDSHRMIKTISGVIFDFDGKELFIGDQKVDLTKNEYKICEVLALHKGRVFTKEEIYEEVYSFDSDALHSTITEFIRRIRKKFKYFQIDPITTVWGVGYKWH
ncbi:response regulator transcription factor [Oceanobacillus sp. J11TS1]|uniref:response regulator transcription factor n=1 Tax=Oceanobacillus sp. J11TS1 TaxID=2807191 RepID=UPI001B0B5CF3|nr:response regulator transcription factor [Oceanobacillus sp. J11TS1]GIO25221.1 DNA-binding response regulator [Oceanobacillus sp. J11TS1]